jgi:hypothetical protein
MASRVAAATTAAVSSTVSQVVEGVIRMFWIKKATAASMAACVVFAMGVGVGMTGRHVEGVAEGQEKVVAKAGEQLDPRSEKSLDDLISDVQRMLESSTNTFRDANEKSQLIRQKIRESREKKTYTAGQELEDLRHLYQAETNLAEAFKGVRSLTEKIATLKSAKGQAGKLLPKSDEPKTDLERIEQRLEDLRERWKTVEAEAMKLKADADIAAKQFEMLAEERKAIDELVTKLMAQRNALLGKKPAVAAKAAGYLELTVRGTAGQYEFALRELDAAGKEVVALVVKDATLNGAMLARVLARTKADPTAPAEMRVIAAPPTAQGIGQQAALKACDAAGYKTVKFTGYIMAGGFTRNLKQDDRGEVPGYRYYDNAEKMAESLDKEIELGRRTW